MVRDRSRSAANRGTRQRLCGTVTAVIARRVSDEAIQHFAVLLLESSLALAMTARGRRVHDEHQNRTAHEVPAHQIACTGLLPLRGLRFICHCRARPGNPSLSQDSLEDGGMRGSPVYATRLRQGFAGSSVLVRRSLGEGGSPRMTPNVGQPPHSQGWADDGRTAPPSAAAHQPGPNPFR
jgi:hypothetical protein